MLSPVGGLGELGYMVLSHITGRVTQLVPGLYDWSDHIVFGGLRVHNCSLISLYTILTKFEILRVSAGEKVNTNQLNYSSILSS